MLTNAGDPRKVCEVRNIICGCLPGLNQGVGSSPEFLIRSCFRVCGICTATQTLHSSLKLQRN